MFTVVQTTDFVQWLRGLKDRVAAKAIVTRIARMQAGLIGDVKPVGEGVSEARIFVGAGYRMYFITRRQVVIIVLCGGDKKSQESDISKAKKIAKDL